MLILAGVSISMVVGDNGILTRAVNASTATDVADTKEQIEVVLVGYLDSNGDYTVKDVLEVAKEITGNDVDTSSKTVESANGNTVDLTDILDGAKASWWYTDDTYTEVTNGSTTLAIGDYVNYDPGDYTYTSLSSVNGKADQEFNTSSYVYGWRVLGVDEDTGELLIISEDYIGPDSGGYTYNNKTYFYICGQKGYVNYENELNAICSIYGNGTGATGARSINVDDINKITGYNPDNVGVYDPEQTGTGTVYGSEYVYEYGNEVTYTLTSGYIYYEGTIYPTSLIKSSSKKFTFLDGETWIALSSGEHVTLTSTYYYYYPNTLTTSADGDTVGISTTSTEYCMLFDTNMSYWVASRMLSCEEGYVNYCVLRMTSSSLSGVNLFISSNAYTTTQSGLRPIVKLSSNIKLNGSSSEGWNIVTD